MGGLAASYQLLSASILVMGDTESEIAERRSGRVAKPVSCHARRRCDGP